jgi:hypothetical protein
MFTSTFCSWSVLNLDIQSDIIICFDCLRTVLKSKSLISASHLAILSFLVMIRWAQLTHELSVNHVNCLSRASFKLRQTSGTRMAPAGNRNYYFCGKKELLICLFHLHLFLSQILLRLDSGFYGHPQSPRSPYRSNASSASLVHLNLLLIALLIGAAFEAK